MIYLKNEQGIESLSFDVPWSKLSTLGIGSKVKVLAEPEDDIELKKIIAICKEKKIKFIILGAGSNILGTDIPYDGIVIRLSAKCFQNISFGRRNHLTAGAGITLHKLAEIAAKNGFSGIAPLAGIPATLGGAIKMNAGTENISIGDFVEEICGIDHNGNIWKASKDEIGFSYRKTKLLDDKIILVAILRLEREDSTQAILQIKKSIAKRKLIKFEGRNAGCVFLNPGDAKAGQLLDKAGCKNMVSGNASISKNHANYFLNSGSATENDFVNLMIRARKKVFKNSGILLEPELKFVNPESFNRLMKKPKEPNVFVLKGGTSNEREISLISAKYVSEALRNAGMTVKEFDIRTAQITKEMKSADVVFPVLHGGFGEDGEIQKSLEKAKIKFVGSKSSSCEITVDKIKSKKIMLAKKIKTAKFAVITRKNKNKLAKFAKKLGMPIVVKAPKEGSTVGISIVEHIKDLASTVERTFEYDDKILLEQFISGIELTVGILHGKALPVIEIEYPGKTYDFDAKYTHKKGETKYHCPPQNINEKIQIKAQKTAVKFYNATNARDMLRVDMIYKNGELFVLEGNSIPGFTDSSLLPKAAKTAGISFVELCARLVMKAWKRN
jgi:D-alanine-D-alanine ligase